jgi:hypothetical protein
VAADVEVEPFVPLGSGEAADTLAALLQDGDGHARFRQLVGGGQARRPGSDDDDPLRAG